MVRIGWIQLTLEIGHWAGVPICASRNGIFARSEEAVSSCLERSEEADGCLDFWTGRPQCPVIPGCDEQCPQLCDTIKVKGSTFFDSLQRLMYPEDRFLCYERVCRAKLRDRDCSSSPGSGVGLIATQWSQSCAHPPLVLYHPHAYLVSKRIL